MTGLQQYIQYNHRVDRVPSFFSSRRNWDCPNPSPAGECAPPPVLGGGAHLLAREGLGESKFRRGDIHRGTLYMYVLCEYNCLTVNGVGIKLALPLTLSFFAVSQRDEVRKNAKRRVQECDVCQIQTETDRQTECNTATGSATDEISEINYL
jgi:hypothetical protein